MIDDLYEQHFNDMFNVKNISKKEYSDDEIDKILKRLIKCLPNGGKLYKYRLIEGNSFENIYKCLRDKYLWLSKPIDLNDDDDTNLNIDLVKDVEYLENYINMHPEKFIDFLIENAIKDDLQKKNILKNKNEIIKYFELEKQELSDSEIINLLIENGYKYYKANECLIKYKIFIETMKKEIEVFARENTEKLIRLSQEIREKAYVYSMSDSYDNDQLWAYYSDNKGFCIEYDYNKADSMDYDKKRKLIHTFKVVYKDKESFSLIPTFKAAINKDEEMLKKENKRANMQILTKKKGWSNENEWRLLLENLNDNKLFLDLVSAIIIDDRSIDTENAQKLINLAKINNWNVMVRKRDIYNKHYYESLE